MRKLLILCSLLLIFSASSFATAPSLTTVTVTLEDSSSQVWKNATWSTSLLPSRSNLATPNNNGNPIVLPQNGTADGSGVFTVTVDDNNVVAPSGSQTQFIICPNAAVRVCNTITLTVTGASEDLSSTINPLLTVPNVSALATPVRAYNDTEVAGGYGSLYVNVTTGILKMCTVTICDGADWAAIGGGSVLTPPVTITTNGSDAIDITLNGIGDNGVVVSANATNQAAFVANVNGDGDAGFVNNLNGNGMSGEVQSITSTGSGESHGELIALAAIGIPATGALIGMDIISTGAGSGAVPSDAIGIKIEDLTGLGAGNTLAIQVMGGMEVDLGSGLVDAAILHNTTGDISLRADGTGFNSGNVNISSADGKITLTGATGGIENVSNATFDNGLTSIISPIRLFALQTLSGTNEDIAGTLAFSASTTSASYTFTQGDGSHVSHCTFAPRFDVGSGQRIWISTLTATTLTFSASTASTGSVDYHCVNTRAF